METDAQLENIVIRCKSGQREAFEQLFELYQPRMKYYVRRLANSSGEPEDILQNIWVTVFRKIHKLRDNASFPVWLYRIARNEVFGRFRKNNKLLELPQEKELSEYKEDNHEFSAEDAEHLHNALNKIQPYHREVLTLSFIEQMTYQQIAEVIQCNIGTVRSRIFYAKQSLRKEMERNNGQL